MSPQRGQRRKTREGKVYFDVFSVSLRKFEHRRGSACKPLGFKDRLIFSLRLEATMLEGHVC